MGDPITTLLFSIGVFACIALGMIGGWQPISSWFLREEDFFARSFHQLHRPNWSPRVAAWMAAGAIPASALALWGIVGHWASPIVGAVVAILLPRKFIEFLIRRRRTKLEDQLVSGIQTLASGVRAGLNLVQSFELLAKNAQPPLSQEIAQLLREYELGMTLEQAMSNCGSRIGSPTYRLLFSALETHRRRGGNLGETLDRIADAIREIHRLEKQVETLTAQGRAAARMMAIMPFVVLLIYRAIDPTGIRMLFTDEVGKLILLGVGILVLLGFLWIRKIIDIDI
jgi:tight adherence protein B